MEGCLPTWTTFPNILRIMCLLPHPTPQLLKRKMPFVLRQPIHKSSFSLAILHFVDGSQQKAEVLGETQSFLITSGKKNPLPPRNTHVKMLIKGKNKPFSVQCPEFREFVMSVSITLRDAQFIYHYYDIVDKV